MSVFLPLSVSASPSTSLVLEAVVVSAAFGGIAWMLGTVRFSGFVAGVVVGTVIYVSVGREGFALLALFFAGGSAVTALGYRRKQRLGAAESAGGARSVWNVAGKGLVAVVCAVLAWGLGRPTWCLVAFVAALAAALGDTVATELGTLVGRRHRTLPGLRPVPAGTPGAVSLEGTFLGASASAVVGACAAATGLVPWSAVWLVVVASVVAGLWESIERRLLGDMVPEAVRGPVLNLDLTLVAALLGGLLWWLTDGHPLG